MSIKSRIKLFSVNEKMLTTFKELSPNLSSAIDFSSLYLDGFDIFLILSQRPPQHESLPQEVQFTKKFAPFINASFQVLLVNLTLCSINP